jgi:E3 ubiquitin-protein ligase SHPRH
MAAARSSLGPKVAALLRDLRAALRDDATAKAVVFSQLPAAVAHVAALLPAEGFPAVRILPGMPEPERRLAVERFNADASVRVFVLHVGTAAAGLTLTAANHMFMLEPFLCASDEAQARNRCHRIGQTKTVSTTVYYTQGTVEERLLAYRAHEAAVPAAMPVAPSAAEAAAAAERRRKGKGPAKRRRDSDGDDASDDDEDDEAPQRKQPRGRRAAAPEDDDGLATLSADASRKQADDAKMRFLFGLLPRDQAAPPAAARLR